MSNQHESSVPLLSPMLSPTWKIASPSRNASFIRAAMAGIALLTISGFIFSMSSLHQGLQMVAKIKEASKDTPISELLAHPTHSAVSCPVAETPVPEKTSIPNTFYNFFEGLRHPVSADSYTDIQGNLFETREDGPWWTESLGKQILIVDIDTRLPNGKNELWNNGRLDWEHVENGGNGVLTASQMNHYLYAQVHGYDYRFFRAHDIEGLHSTWVKPHVLYEMLPDYKFVAFLDGDALVNNLDVPLEWMFNRWGITEQTSIAVPLDVRQGGTTGEDSHGNTEVNTGFLVVQNIDMTFELLQAWKECTNETRYPGCGRWKEEWSHEQRAFSEYIRYDPAFTVNTSNIVQISCDDAMGYPGLGDLGWIQDDCRGNFIRHHTINKAQTVRRAELAILQGVVDLARKDLMRNQFTYRIDEREKEKAEHTRLNLTMTAELEREKEQQKKNSTSTDSEEDRE